MSVCVVVVEGGGVGGVLPGPTGSLWAGISTNFEIKIMYMLYIVMIAIS